ncbi:DotU family type VI secretion system protein [Paraburkholderia sp. CNPSo 3157]|uniref:DotU family type VI secretion system protein n=1 Tax=Paraburkholderia franconis TaxID=2654983 RepID=A0A7X1NG60_9BURK|nr:DotU family type VI secretion system protein [Paraburkholderia franconis]MPW21307.1 DotU family type VI secretion system protein [Paraburkholderia franconis]
MNHWHEAVAGAHGGFVRPNPGGAPPTPDAQAANSAPQEPMPDYAVPVGSNPLVAVANPLLNLVPQIRWTVHHPNPRWLREHLASEIRQFEMRAQRAGVALEAIVGARYCVCTALDEAASLTPWGGSGAWSADSLLVAFHNETWGGEKFFQVLARLSEHPQQHLDLIELLYCCLALGFEGRYRVLDNGRAQLDALMQRVAQLIRQARGEFDAPLSPHWRDEIPTERARRFIVPVWACAALAGLIGFGAYLAFELTLARQSDQVFASIDRVHVPHLQSQQPVVESARPASAPRLAGFLDPEVSAGLVSVRDDADRSVVTLHGDGLFESGSAAVIGRYASVLARVADALERAPGRIVVAGYSDNVPVRSARFASNWDLSQARAEAVARLLASRVTQTDRIHAEGRGEMDPVAPNDTPANRARNRRVEITLLAAPSSDGAASSTKVTP